MQTPMPPPGGTVYGVVLNDRASLAALGPALHEAPYKGAPRAPVMYIKPANTLAAAGAVVRLPEGAGEVEIGATVGVLIGAEVARLTLESAWTAVAGFVPVADLGLPHASCYRPAIREKCFDGACPLGTPVSADAVGPLAGIALRTFVNGELTASRSLDDLVRPLPELLRDVTEFMTLRRGDLLLVGVPYQGPRAPAGAAVRIDIDRVGSLAFSIADAGGAR